MRILNKISGQFENIIACLEDANLTLQKLPVEFVSQAQVYEFHTKIENLIEDIEEFQYETCAPLEMQNEEREAEIKMLEKRLAELRAA